MFSNFQVELIWFFLGLALLLSELVFPAFILLFFGIGAWITSLCVLLGAAGPLNTQLIVFLATSVLSLVFFRRKGKSVARGKVSQSLNERSNFDPVIGCRGIVLENIEPQKFTGRVELHGTSWRAASEVLISKGAPVEVIYRENLTLIVEPLNSNFTTNNKV
jgi:membrane protein implicated in regulation of membrane protease activity